ncbi:TPA: hypothetical protein H1016_00765 [archaeon]|uniref:Uncharacterized protein n=1 Tax=Candidatus Naiadarchaeum limnaeum TaxID=2756139 RepID=A0A832UUR2_9ARCH|nr:hypothetical protein [Candidatus Naiadarchaeum limnaeum]
MFETLENTSNALAGIINFSKFANAFYIELLDTIDFLKGDENLEELKKKIEQNIGKQGGGEKRFF